MPVDSAISLQVGERHFVTLKSTLKKKSSFFRALLTEEWQNSRSLDDSYFVDADSDLFVHILRYLRRGVFFLFYKATYRFDFALYQALQEKALYFEIEDLHI
jgi:BTB/POZ domain-containing protein KCTD9